MVESLVSVVMPVYNAGKYLGKAIEDVLNQTYTSFELICVNDGSTDESSKVLESFAKRDNRIKVYTQKNSGAGAARNRGMDEALGKYIIFLDSDDRFNECLLEVAIDEIEKYKADVLVFDAEYYDMSYDLIIPSDHMVHRDRLPDKEIFSWKDCPDRFLDIFFHVVWNKLYRRDYLVEYSIRFQNTPYMNDVFFHHASMIEAKRIRFLDRKLITYGYRKTNSVTNTENFAKNPQVACDVTDGVIEYLVQKGIYDEVKGGLIANAVLRLSGLLETSDKEVFPIMYQIYRAYLKNVLQAQELYDLEWVEEWVKKWVKALLGYSETEFVLWDFCCFRDRCNELTITVRSLEEKLREYQLENGFLIKNKRWTYDSKFFSPGERIIIYAAGDVGTDFVNQLLRENSLRLVAWVDRNFTSLDPKLKITSPEVIKEARFDKLIIAIRDMRVAIEVKNEIERMVSSKKILLMKDILIGDYYEQN